VKIANPGPRMPATFAAAIEYCYVRATNHERSQGDVAKAYGVSAPSVSNAYRPIWNALGVVAGPEATRVAPAGRADPVAHGATRARSIVPILVLKSIGERFGQLEGMVNREAAETNVEIVWEVLEMVGAAQGKG